MPQINGYTIPDKRVLYSQAVTTGTPDVIAAKDIWLTSIRFANTTAGALTVTLRDGQGSPVSKYAAVSIAANSVSLERLEEPLYCPSGADVVASGAGINADIVGYTKP